MAATVAGRRLTEAHRLAQARLGAVTVARMRGVWSLIEPSDIDGSTARWLRVAVPVVQRQHATSAQLAASYYTAFRTLEIDEALVVPPLADLPIRQVATSLEVTGPVALKEAIAREVPLVKALSHAQTKAAGAALRLALGGGRGTVLAAIDADEKAIGWARVMSGDPCSFCAMLASRGPVYRSAGTGGFRAHDHCTCSIEPAYSRDQEWPPGSRNARAVYDEATLGAGTGRDRLNAFRRAWPGRA